MLIVWDYFGVMAQDYFWYKAVALAKPHYSDDVARLHHDVNLGTITWKEYCEGIARDLNLSYEDVAARYQQHKINQDAILTIKQLSHHTHVLLSNASSEYLLPIMHRLHLFELFEECYVSSDLGYVKPDERAFLHVLEKKSTPPEQSIMIDDSAANIRSAAAVGRRTLHYDGSLSLLESLKALTST